MLYTTVYINASSPPYHFNPDPLNMSEQCLPKYVNIKANTKYIFSYFLLLNLFWLSCGFFLTVAGMDTNRIPQSSRKKCSFNVQQWSRLPVYHSSACIVVYSPIINSSCEISLKVWNIPQKFKYCPRCKKLTKVWISILGVKFYLRDAILNNVWNTIHHNILLKVCRPNSIGRPKAKFLPYQNIMPCKRYEVIYQNCNKCWKSVNNKPL